MITASSVKDYRPMATRAPSSMPIVTDKLMIIATLSRSLAQSVGLDMVLLSLF